MNEPLAKVVEIIGGQKALADAMGHPIKQGHVWSWLNVTKDGTPPEHVINVSRIVEYKVPPHELRPDLYPHPDDGLPANLRHAA
jgi:DNA-binding transcriptional regulator YdaS (Cro superfamily)